MQIEPHKAYILCRVTDMAFDLNKLFYLEALEMWHNVIGAHGKRNLMKLSPLKSRT